MQGLIRNEHLGLILWMTGVHCGRDEGWVRSGVGNLGESKPEEKDGQSEREQEEVGTRGHLADRWNWS